MVDPFEIDQMQQCLAHANVLEQSAPRIEHEAVHALRQTERQAFLHGFAVRMAGKIVCRLPAARVGFESQVAIAALEGFEMLLPSR